MPRIKSSSGRKKLNNASYEYLLNAALRFVSYRPRSEKELRVFLFKKSVSEHTDAVIARMQELGYVDDSAFAAWWVDQRTRFRYSGSRKIRFELKEKGISSERIDAAVPVDDLPAAIAAVSKRMNSWNALPKHEQKAKIFSFLMRRGFGRGTIAAVIDAREKKSYNKP